MVASVGGAFSMNETCPACGGRQLVYDEPCPTCHGSGRGLSARSIQARIPAGVKDGQRIRLRGKGAAGENGGPAGDLFVTVKVSPAPALRPQGRQPHPRRAGLLRRGRARRRDQGPDARRCPGHPEDPGRHPQRPHLPGARQGRAARPTAPRATCSPPSRSRCPRVLDAAAREAVEAYRAATAGQAAARQPLRGRRDGPSAREFRAARPGRGGLRHQRGRRADRAAPADPAHLRAARPDHARAAPAAAAVATPTATSSCSARSPTSPPPASASRGCAGSSTCRTSVDRAGPAQRGAGGRARGHPRGAAPGGWSGARRGDGAVTAPGEPAPGAAAADPPGQSLSSGAQQPLARRRAPTRRGTAQPRTLRMWSKRPAICAAYASAAGPPPLYSCAAAVQLPAGAVQRGDVAEADEHVGVRLPGPAEPIGLVLVRRPGQLHRPDALHLAGALADLLVGQVLRPGDLAGTGEDRRVAAEDVAAAAGLLLQERAPDVVAGCPPSRVARRAMPAIVHPARLAASTCSGVGRGWPGRCEDAWLRRLRRRDAPAGRGRRPGRVGGVVEPEGGDDELEEGQERRRAAGRPCRARLERRGRNGAWIYFLGWGWHPPAAAHGSLPHGGLRPAAATRGRSPVAAARRA